MATPTAGPTMASPILNMLDTNLEVASLASTPAQSNNSIEHLQVKRSSDVKEVEVYIPTNITRRVKINDDDLGPEIIESGEVTRPEGPQQKVKQPIKQEKSKQQKIEQPTIPEPQQKEPVTAEQTTTEKLVPLQENLAGYNLEEAMRIFKAEHEQYVQSLISDQESTLAQEIREIYCSTATDHKLNLVAMAQTNGLLAAKKNMRKINRDGASNSVTTMQTRNSNFNTQRDPLRNRTNYRERKWPTSYVSKGWNVNLPLR